MNSPENNLTDLKQQNKESMDDLSEQQDDRWTGPHIGPAPEPQPIPAAEGEAPIALLSEQQSETQTPRTDSEHCNARVGHQAMADKDWPWKAISEGWDFARQLERELAEARREIADLRAQVRELATGEVS